jgi:three-Cys-motif partner protein
LEDVEAVAKRTQRYGGSATEIKAEIVTEYVSFYGRALKNQNFETGYFDAFAGSGWTDTGNLEAGRSVALRVLEAPDPLAYYAFNDINPQNADSLREAVEDLRQKRIQQNVPIPVTRITTQDGNAAIRDACAWVRESYSRRAVIFLDPFGMQVDWSSMEAIAQTGRLDVWLLVPTGQAINRMLRRDGNIPPSWRARFDTFFGDPGWSDRLYSPSPNLFGELDHERVAMEDIERYVIDRLKTIFPPGAVHRSGLRLVRQSHPQFLLAFACANPRPAAYGLALKAADYLIERAQRP